MRYLYTLMIFTLAFACKQDNHTDLPQAPRTINSTETKAAPASELPPITQEQIIELYEEADYIDYIFFDWSFSMNQADSNAVKAAVTFISDQPVMGFSPSCKPIGRIIFNSKGETLQEADLYFSEGCYFYSFVNEDNRPAQRNQMTEQGQGFYQDMFAKAHQPAAE